MIHVLPIDDLQEHTRDTVCPCGPRVEIEPDSDLLVIHSAFDGREMIERETGESSGCGDWSVEECDE